MLLKLTSLQLNIQDFEMRIIKKKIKTLKEKKGGGEEGEGDKIVLSLYFVPHLRYMHYCHFL